MAVFIGTFEDDLFVGSSETDTVLYVNATSSVTVNLELGISTGFGVDTFINIENIIGSAFDDVLVGDTQNNILSGEDGNDILIGGNGNDTLRGGAGDDRIDGGAGIDTVQLTDSTGSVTVNLQLGTSTGFGTDTLVNIENVVGSAFNDVLVGDAKDNVLSGGNGNDILIGGDGSDMLNGDAGNDIISGGNGKDTLRGGAGDDTLDGGEGLDIASFSGIRYSYTLTRAGSSWSISSITDGTDVLTNIERLLFADRTVALDISGNAGQAYRIYQAAFNRIPDNDGLKFWIVQMDGGASLNSVAAGFVASAEFQKLYGVNATNEHFITKLYNNVLQRAPDPGGFNFWLTALNNNNVDRVSTLSQFSESPENQVSVIGVIQNGIDLFNTII